MNYKFDIDLSNGERTWANAKITDCNSILIGMYEGGKIERTLFLMDREQAKQLVKILDAFAHEWL